MEDKNIELCKLLGIKPKKCVNDEYDEICSKYDECKNAPSCNIYPNLSKPANFIQLLELQIYDKDDNERYETVLEMLCYLGFFGRDRKMVIEFLIENNYNYNTLVYLKQVAQFITWEY